MSAATCLRRHCGLAMRCHPLGDPQRGAANKRFVTGGRSLLPLAYRSPSLRHPLRRAADELAGGGLLGAADAAELGGGGGGARDGRGAQGGGAGRSEAGGRSRGVGRSRHRFGANSRGGRAVRRYGTQRIQPPLWPTGGHLAAVRVIFCVDDGGGGG